MNSKKNSFKRVAAGALAVLTVAAYTVPAANVGGLLNTSVLTAEAATGDKHTFDFTGLTWVMTSIADTSGISYTATQIQDNTLTSVKLVEGKKATIKSVTPLTFVIPEQKATYTDAVSGGKVRAGFKAVKKADASVIIKAGENFTADKDDYDYFQVEFTSAKNSYTSSGSTSAGYTYTFTVPGYDFDATAQKSIIDVRTAVGEKLGTKEITSAVSSVSGTTTGSVYQNQKFTIYSPDCFQAFAFETDGVNVNTKVGVKTYSANYISDTKHPHYGEYYVQIPAVVHAAGYDTTSILINKTNPTLTYSLTDNNSKLKATGSGIDTVVAGISATAVNYDTKTSGYPTVDPEKNVLPANSEAQKNKTRVDLSLTAEPKFIAKTTVNSADVYGVLSIKFNGIELKDDATPFVDDFGNKIATTYKDAKDAVAAAATKADLTAIDYLKFNTAGSYVVTYTVYTAASNGAISARTLTYKFSIATLDKLTVNNVKVEFDKANSSANVEDILVKDPKTGEPAIKLVNGVYTIEVLEGKSLGNKTVAVTAELYKDTKKTEPFVGADISGSQKVSSVGKTQTITISYNDPEYSSKEESISVKWKVANAAKSVLVLNAQKYKTDDENGTFDIAIAATHLEDWYKPNTVNSSVDEIKDLQAKIEKNITVVNGDIADVTYEYVKGAGAELDDSELDTHTEGLPSKQGDYSVYILYKGEVKNIINVNIYEHGLYAAPTSKQLNLTYGTPLFNETNLKYADYTGKKVSDAGVSDVGIKVYTTKKLTKAEIKQIDDDGKYNGYTVYDINGDKYIQSNVFEFSDAPDNYKKSYEQGTGIYYQDGDLLPAGNYIVRTYNAGTKVEKDGYVFLDKDFVVTVAKKQITKDMILIDPATYNNGKSVDMGDIHGADAKAVVDGNAYDIALKLADGVSSGKKVGGYDATVTVDDGELNYTGSVDVQWFIVKEGDILAGLDWNEAKTTLYDNGKIHFEFQRPANSNLDSAVAEYGILVEKNGKIGAPETVTNLKEYLDAKNDGTYGENNPYNDKNVAAAYTALQYGNGMVASGQQSAAQAKQNGGQICGVNVSVLNAEVGAWARPYLVLKDGSIHYGEVRYLNLTYEAYDKLNLKITQIGADDQVKQTAVTRETVKKDLTSEELKDKATWRQNVYSGYNEEKGKFYVYANYNLSSDTNVKPEAVQAFGFVADKTGKIGTYEELNTKYAGDYTKVIKSVSDSLKIGKNFTEGRASKTSKTMDFDEIGANITPVDAATGVWVRSFVDFGNGLVVYTEPQYLGSVSGQYKYGDNDYTPVLNLKTDGAKNVYEVLDPAYYPTDENGTVSIKKAGVIIDNNGSLYKWDKFANAGLGAYVLKDNVFPQYELTVENASKKNFVATAKAPTSGATIFTGKLTPKTDSNNNAIPVLARPYVIYSINGVDVTVYGNVVEVLDQLATGTTYDVLD